jgi:hypothetical protein
MWQKSPPRERSILNRRPFLRNFLGLGMGIATRTFDRPQDDKLRLAEGQTSSADSLFLYTNLLDRVSNEAFHLMADAVAIDYQDCSKLLDQFGQDLSDLRRELCETSTGTAQNQTERKLDAAHQDVESLRVSLSSPPRQADGALSMASMIAQGMGRCVGKLLPDGEITLNSKARQILSDMLVLVDKQQAIAAKAASRQLDLNRAWQKMYLKFETMRSDLLSAARDILQAGDLRAGADDIKSILNLANNKIEITVAELKKVQVHQQGVGTKNDLTTLLGAVQATLSPNKTQTVTSISFRTPYRAGQDFDSIGITALSRESQSDEKLQDRVISIVRENFQPGSNIQAWECMALCMPVWIAFSGNEDVRIRTRKNLIQGALVVFREVRNIERVALDLAVAYPNYSS